MIFKSPLTEAEKTNFEKSLELDVKDVDFYKMDTKIQ